MKLINVLFNIMRRSKSPSLVSISEVEVTCSVEVHDFVVWHSQGNAQWLAPRRVVHLEFANGEWWAFCDGGMTGLRTSELIKQ